MLGPSNRWGMQPWALSLPDKELCLREALAVCTPPAPEPSAKLETTAVGSRHKEQEVFLGGRRETLVSLAFCRGP